MDKIKELRERVRLTPEEMARAIERPVKFINWQHEAIAKKQLNKVLKEDLALMLNPQYIDWGKDPETAKQSILALVIPLAEAIKEAQDDTLQKS